MKPSLYPQDFVLTKIQKTADGLLNKLKTKLATTDAKKRKAPRPAPSPNPTKVSRKVVSQSKPSKTETPSPPVVVGVKNVVPIAPKKPGQHNLKSKKILCYMPQTLNKNFTVKIPAKPEKPSSQGSFKNLRAPNFKTGSSSVARIPC